MKHFQNYYVSILPLMLLFLEPSLHVLQQNQVLNLFFDCLGRHYIRKIRLTVKSIKLQESKKPYRYCGSGIANCTVKQLLSKNYLQENFSVSFLKMNKKQLYVEIPKYRSNICLLCFHFVQTEVHHVLYPRYDILSCQMSDMNCTIF